MDKLFQTGILVSDFNLSNLTGYLRSESGFADLGIELTPYGQVIPSLAELAASARIQPSAFAVVWTRPESVIPSFQRALQYKPATLQEVLSEVDQFADCLLRVAENVKIVIAPAWMTPPSHRGLGMLDLRHESGLTRLLLQMNLCLAEKLAGAPNVFLLDAQRWIAAAGKNAFSSKLWYMAKVPFSNDVFREAAADIIACLRGVTGSTRKLLILDLDETLWGGIVGEVGWEKLRLGGHDFVGEAYADFQRALKSFTNRGILLGIASKNDEPVALEAIQKHPEMILRLEDFAGWKINWKDKAQNIADLVAELKLGLQSAVFIDDNPVERARVREALPEVFVPDWPDDCMLFPSALLAMRCFDAPTISNEDLQRTELYRSERQREALKTRVGDLNEWLKTLNITVQVQELNEANLDRTIQLLNKTNQMNLATRRMTAPEFKAWAGAPSRKVWNVRVSDRFGDAGLTGLVSMEIENSHARIVDFLLSCRVMGRKVEETMLHLAVSHARSAGAKEVLAEYVPTPKNAPCLEFWKRSHFAHQESKNAFSWDARQEYPAPEFVTIQRAGERPTETQ